MKPLVTKYSASKTRPERLRTCSSDSGCDVQCEALLELQEERTRHSTIRSARRPLIRLKANELLVFRYCESRLQETVKIKLKQPALTVSEEEEEEEEEASWRRQLVRSLDLTASQVYWETQVD